MTKEENVIKAETSNPLHYVEANYSYSSATNTVIALQGNVYSFFDCIINFKNGLYRKILFGRVFQRTSAARFTGVALQWPSG